MNQLHEKWNQSFQETLIKIQTYLTSQENDSQEKKQFRLLANWMMETEINPYSFMPEKFTNFKDNPYQTKDTLALLQHAMVDDGDVSFVKMSIGDKVERVFMIFAWSKEDNFIKICQEANHLFIQSMINGSCSRHELLKKLQRKDIPPQLTLEDVKFTVINTVEDFIKEVNKNEEKYKMPIKNKNKP